MASFLCLLNMHNISEYNSSNITNCGVCSHHINTGYGDILLIFDLDNRNDPNPKASHRFIYMKAVSGPLTMLCLVAGNNIF